MKKTFKQAVKEIKDAERNVNKVLDAAQLQRTPREHISADDKVMLIIMGGAMLCMLAIFAMMFFAIKL